MFERTQKIIQKLAAVDWFSAVGQELDVDVERVTSWQQAAQKCEEVEWESVHWRVRSKLFEIIDVAAKAAKGDSPRNWNTVMHEIEAELLPIVHEKTKLVIEGFSLSKLVIAQIEWDITHYAASVDYSDVYASSFYHQLGQLYLDGHFPCGWSGDYPVGKVIVF